jgi:hypothetical protein
MRNDPAVKSLTYSLLVAVSITVALLVATRAMAAPAPEASRIASHYATWAGGRANAEALVTGLRNGASITLVTTGPERSIAMAGFTPQARLQPAEIEAALGNAQRTLARLGIRQPNADQIQAALIGGEVALADGRTRQLAGSVAVNAAPTQVVNR